tara:strand:- start:1761 stop:2024 length:264 start_codon:yes stop_codon:yes gene_type:complete
MEYGIEVDELVTIEMIQKGHWLPGVLLEVAGQIFMVMGYTYWGWVADCESTDLHYDVILYHINTGWHTNFPLPTIVRYAITMEVKNK